MATVSYGTGPTWFYWSDLSVTSTASTTVSCNRVWSDWVTTSTDCTYATTGTDTTWYGWSGDNTHYHSTPQPVRAETAEERQANDRAYQEQLAEYARKEAIRLEKEKAKEEKARQLLKEVLTEDQDAQLTKDGYFELTSVKSGKRYRIKKGYSMNVEELDAQGKKLRSLCFHPQDAVHHYDNMAIQKLMLENDEEEVRKVANFS